MNRIKDCRRSRGARIGGMQNQTAGTLVFRVDGMKEPATSSATRAMTAQDNDASVDGLVQAFNDARAELVSTLFYMLGNHADAQDAAQEAFLKCWRARHSVDKIRDFRAWIFRVALNAAKDLQRNAYYRRARPLADSAVNDDTAVPSPLEAVQDMEARDRLREALLSLRPEEKEVFLLRENGDLTYEEIAKQRRCPVGTIKTQMRTAIRKLRAVLQEK